MLIQFQFQSHCYSIGLGGGGRLFEFDWEEGLGVVMGAYSRWVLIRGWALIRINTVVFHSITELYLVWSLDVALRLVCLGRVHKALVAKENLPIRLGNR